MRYRWSLISPRDAVGRPLREAKSATIDISHLEKLAGAVMATSDAADVEVRDAAGNWRLLRIRAYHTSAGEIDGAIVAVLDINELKRAVLIAEAATRAAMMQSEAGALLASSLINHASSDSVRDGLLLNSKARSASSDRHSLASGSSRKSYEGRPITLTSFE